MAVSVSRRRRFTVDEYYAMARAGIFKPGERVELLDGEVVAMNPIGSPHLWCVYRLGRIFDRLGDRVMVITQSPLRLDSYGEPEPDTVVLRPGTPQDRLPGPAEALLVIEVSDSSIRTDRGRKRRMYARASIADYWIVDLNADRLEVYRDPSAARYRSASLYGRGDTIAPLFAPDHIVDVTEILGQQAPRP